MIDVSTDADVKQRNAVSREGNSSDAAADSSDSDVSESDVAMATTAATAAANDDDDTKHRSHVAIDNLDTRTSVETVLEKTAVHIIADGDAESGHRGGSVAAKSDFSFVTSFLQHLMMLLDSFETLVDIAADDVARKLCIYSLFTVY